ncbi:MAG: isochorismatase family cysteine hydrolase, partial [Myxococcaceae bacterium]|nr:isochorismatase family cysteine hydrolase [Myxococcaceae bacterium]
TAVLLLDLQRDFLEPTGQMPIDASQVEPVLQTSADLAALASREGWPVVRVVNDFDPGDLGNLFRNQAAVRGSLGAEWDARAPSTAEVIVPKQAPDAFSNPHLAAFLDERQVMTVFVAGVFADQCVAATIGSARARGFRVLVVRGGVGAGSRAAWSAALDGYARQGVELLDEVGALAR